MKVEELKIEEDVLLLDIMQGINSTPLLIFAPYTKCTFYPTISELNSNFYSSMMSAGACKMEAGLVSRCCAYSLCVPSDGVCRKLPHWMQYLSLNNAIHSIKCVFIVLFCFWRWFLQYYLESRGFNKWMAATGLLCLGLFRENAENLKMT